MGHYSTAVASRFFTTALAAASAGILTLSLITAPPKIDVAVPRAGVEVVQLAAATTAEISTTAVRLASAVTPASLSPTSGTHPAATSPGTTTAAAVPENIAFDLLLVAGVALGVVIAPIWYLAFPLSLPYSYTLTQNLNNFGSALCAAGFGCPGGPPPAPTPRQLLQNTLATFLFAPFLVGVLAVAYVATYLPAASAVQTTPKTAKAQLRVAIPAQVTASVKPQSSPMAGNGKLTHQVPSAASTIHTHSTAKAH
jgi:hypothetical protein